MQQQRAAAAVHCTNWVQCERCQKWRRVSDEYASTVDDDVEWYCELNPDPQHAKCSIPQELTDEQIDQEAAEFAELAAGGGPAQPSPPPEEEREQQREQPQGKLPKLPAVIQLISENVFSHRKRKQQDEDDIMVCHCPPPWRGGDGCGPACINRMLCIECTEDFCPCENQCNNQMFSRKQYAKVSVRRAGPKGFGLYADQDIGAGDFVIQYVGEVLEEEEYLRRKHYYIQTGQRHYYFMNIGNGEVIDACRKGNVARFINHSCEPNCETQKWMVRGELAIGLFTLRKIKAGEELTFDYNFERYGDKPMRCFCGSQRCRKFIGGTQETTANIVELGDAEDVTNDPEPVLVQEGEMDGLVQAMLDKEVGTTQRNWDSKLLGRLQELCRKKGLSWSYTDEAGRTASTAAAATSSLAAEYQSEESSHAAGALPAATAASPASSSAPASGVIFKAGLDDAESRPAGQKAAPKRSQKRKRKVDEDPAAAAAAALKKQQQEERKRQRLLKQQERQQKQQQEFLRRQEQELQRLQRLRQQQQLPPGERQQQRGKKRQHQKGDEAAGQQQDGGEKEPAEHDLELEDAMSSEDYQQEGQQDVSGALAGGQSAEESSESSEDEDEGEGEEEQEEEEQQQQQQQQQQQKQPAQRPFSSRIKVVQGGQRLKPPLAPRQPPKEAAAAPPAKRSFLTLAVSTAASRPVKKRSEVDRRLEQLVQKQSWKLKEPSKSTVIKVLRMFNLCDITPRQPDNNLLQQQQQQQGPSAGSGSGNQQQDGQQQQQGDAAEPQHMGGAAVVGEEGLPALPAHLQPLQALRGAELEARERESEARFKARQRARMADMGMILDVVLASSGEKLKKEWVTCGILTQLQQALGRIPFSAEYSVVLVKVVGVLEHLPITSDDLYTMRSAHGTFADLIRRMASSATDWEVRRRSHQLLRRYAAASCSDATLLQLYQMPGPNGRPYLLSLHLPAPQLARLTAMLPKSADNNANRRRVSRQRTPPPMRGPGPAGPWPPAGQGPKAAAAGEPHSSPSTSHGAAGAAAAGAAAGQDGGSSMAADSSGGWPPPQHQQQPWEGAALPPPPWAAGGGGPPAPLPPGYRPGRHHRHAGWQQGGPPLPRPGSAGAVGVLAQGSPGEWPDRPQAAGSEDTGPAALAPGSIVGAPADRGLAAGEGSPGRDGPSSRRGPDGQQPWGPPHGDWGAGERYGGWYGPPGAGMGAAEGGPMPYSYRERERERERELERQRGWGRREHEWGQQGEYNDRGREREWERGWHMDDGAAAGAKRQRREAGEGPGWQWGYGSPHDAPPHRMPPPGGWQPEGPYGGWGGAPQHGGGPWGPGDEAAAAEEGGWRQQDPAAAAAQGRGGRQGGWQPGQHNPPAADPSSVPRSGAAVEDLFVLGVADSVVSPADWQEWCAAVGPGATEGPLSPIVGGPGGSRPHTPHVPPGEADAHGRRHQGWDSEGAAAACWGPPGNNYAAGQQQQQHGRQQGATPSEQQPRQQQQYPDSWEQPGPDFEAFVGEAVKHRLGKYVQPDHPTRITKEEAQQLYRKLRREVVQKEAAACAERQAAGSFKPIERSKLEANIKEFVRLSIRRLHAARGGGGGGTGVGAGHHAAVAGMNGHR